MSKIVFITGATAGFGKADAIKFAQNGWNCIISGRRKERLDSLAKELEEKYKVEVLPLEIDVQSRTDVFDKIGAIPEKWQNIDVLINNAGLALGTENFEDADLDNWDTMIDTNVKGLLYVSKAIIPFFIAHKKGHIINMTSTAAKDVYPGGNIYCATKHAVDAITKAQRIELLKYGIKVTAIAPGAADTEFSQVRFKGDTSKADKVYTGYEPLHAEDIADTIFYCANLPKHVCINDLVITCTAQANAFFFDKK
ncbi:SDR family NAD(P)-dependent oxidoreductase [Rhizosphaericola mali]|uniref:SDR family NAD(P)-dependent oxidoreductase n=1 Tax=Rhizosphaericola mali TaxID=2545455 RepID=A0A5P2G728_9BACT|nr:SDR family NAD(P)-dependent oxidoreductase [Rhizosphaericola mali]QES89033.1 SDR family NAD(P)-dependent oxidoreductase [Rhizosphaericola mali]